MSEITILGLGAMGHALASTLLAAGHQTTVWNRSPAKAAPLEAKGARHSSSVVDAVTSSPVTAVCLLDYAAVRQTLTPAAEALMGRLLVNVTNGTPAEAREMAEWAKDHGIEYIDGGIMAVPPMIGTDSAYILYSGQGEAGFAACKPVLESIAKAVFVGKDPGLASLLDLALNGAMYGMVGGAMHAMAMVRAEGMKTEDFANILLVPYLNAIAGILPHMGRQVDSRDYATGVISNLAMQATGFVNIRQASKDQGVSTELLDPIQSLMDRRVAGGFGGEDFSSITELMQA